MIKKVCLCFCCVFLILTLLGCENSIFHRNDIPDNVYRLIVNGEDITKDNVDHLTFREDGKVLIPLLAVLRALGGKVSISEEKCTVTKGFAKYDWYIKNGKIDMGLGLAGGYEPSYVEWTGDEILAELLIVNTVLVNGNIWKHRAEISGQTIIVSKYIPESTLSEKAAVPDAMLFVNDEKFTPLQSKNALHVR